LRDSNLPKFLTDDAILFRAILSDLFPGVVLEDHDYGSLQSAIEHCIKAKGLVLTELQVAKVIQFYETMVVRHGVMLVGPTGGGKTSCYEVLQDALTKLGEDGEGSVNSQYKNVQTYVMNPKSVSMGELYGEVSLATSEWTDGLMATTVRECVKQGNENEDHQWIMCDGRRPVDREHEHGVRRQQDALPCKQRADQAHPVYAHVFRGQRPGSGKPSHRQPLRTGLC
jgi:dynein heavy chain